MIFASQQASRISEEEVAKERLIKSFFEEISNLITETMERIQYLDSHKEGFERWLNRDHRN